MGARVKPSESNGTVLILGRGENRSPPCSIYRTWLRAVLELLLKLSRKLPRMIKGVAGFRFKRASAGVNKCVGSPSQHQPPSETPRIDIALSPCSNLKRHFRTDTPAFSSATSD